MAARIERHLSRCLGFIAAAALSLGPLAAGGQEVRATPAANSGTAALDQARLALDKYRDPVAAIHDGYLSTLACINYPQGAREGSMQYKAGAMGVHFLNLGHVGPTLDPAKPQVLIYEPAGDKLQLVAAEWFVPVQAAGNARPAIFGKELDGPMAGHAPIMPEGLHHYDLHVWLWKKNPAGVFSPTNADVTCPKGAYSFDESAPKMVGHPKHP